MKERNGLGISRPDTKVNYETGTDIVALSTPYATSALCVIRASGDTVREKISKIFSASDKLNASEGGNFFYGKLKDPQSGQIVDEVVLIYAKAPRSYTGEDVIEIMGHGSLPGIDAILRLCVKVGMRQALPGEFTFRSFVKGRIDLTQAEAVHEIVVSTHEQAHLMALKRLSGTLTKEINLIKEQLMNVMAQLNIQLDYAEDEVLDLGETVPLTELKQTIASLERLEAGYELGIKHKNGFRLVLAGKTNAGKSSLFNLLVRQDRSIVSSMAGTTRDYVESQLVLAGQLVCLFDTAGLRDSQEEVEQEGIRRSHELFAKAQLILYVHDAKEELGEEEALFFKSNLSQRKKLILVINKIDSIDIAKQEIWQTKLQTLNIPYVLLSTVNLRGLERLIEEIVEQVKSLSPPSGEQVYLESKRQLSLVKLARESLQEAQEAALKKLPVDLLALDCHRALLALGELTGEVSNEDILERMFSSFCVGK